MTEPWIKIQGQVQCKPNRQNVRKKRAHEEDLSIVKVANDIGALYRWLLEKQYGIKLDPPAFGCHVTILDGRRPVKADKESILKSIDKKNITLEYSPYIYRHWEFFAVKVKSNALNEIRTSLGHQPTDTFHITIGRLSQSSKLIEGRLLCLKL